jgi:hypothetical protein
LEKKFGQSYVDWSMKVNDFWPGFKNYEKTSIPFSMKTILRREYSGVTATILGFVFVAFLRESFQSGEVHFKTVYGIVVGVGLSISLVLRTLKHKTAILFEEDRS